MFTNNRLDFYNNKTYEEKSHASALGKGIPSFVVKGLDLNGTILDSGIFTNVGTFGQLGNEGETLDITTLEGWTSGYDGYLVIHSILSGSGSTSFPELSTTRKDTDPRDTGNIKYFTIYKLNAGAIEQDFRHINYVKEYRFEQGESGVGWFRSVLNGFKSNEFSLPALLGNVLSVNNVEPDTNGNVDVVKYSFAQLGITDAAQASNNFETYSRVVMNALISKSPQNMSEAVLYFNDTHNAYSSINNTLSVTGCWNSIPAGHRYMAKWKTISNEINMSSDFLEIEVIDLDTNKKYFMNIANNFLDENLIINEKGLLSDVKVPLYVSASGNQKTPFTLSESFKNFEKVEIVGYDGSIFLSKVVSVDETTNELFWSVEKEYDTFSRRFSAFISFDNAGTGGSTDAERFVASSTEQHATGTITRDATFLLKEINGIDRIFPEGTTHSLLNDLMQDNEVPTQVGINEEL